MVAATVPGTVVITLPPSPNVGDTVSVTGQSANSWQLAQNAGQSVVTSNVSGNPVPGATWTPHESPRNWWWATSSADGNKLAVVSNYGPIFTSADGGTTWAQKAFDQAWACIASSADGNTLAAVGYATGVFVSTDSGTNWDLRLATSDDWVGVTTSTDATHMAAVARFAPIYTSADSGKTWTARETSRDWRAVASSADGQKLVAVVMGGQIYTSTDAGVTWTPRESNRSWYRVASSADGTRLAAADQGGLIYTSSDSGVTWTPRFRAAAYNGIASSADGNTLALIVPDNVPWEPQRAGLYLDRRGRHLDRARESSRGWRGIGMSADGNRLVAAEFGGLIYTSGGNRTSAGALGSITAGQNDAIELRYRGNGQFEVLNASGGPFAIR